MLKRMARTLIYMCICLVCALPAVAQQVSITAQVSQPKAGPDEMLELVYEIENLKGNADFQGPNLNNFSVLSGPSQGSSYKEINFNGQITQKQMLYISYLIRPRKTGTFTIGAAHLVINGKKYASNSVTVEVVKNTRSASGHPFDAFARRGGTTPRDRRNIEEPPSLSEADIRKNIFIKVVIDKTQPYLGEQVTASYKLYTRLPMTMSITQLPALNGFWSEDYELPRVPKPSEEVVNGLSYQVFTLKKSALFPQQTGKLTLDIAQAEGTIRIIEKVKGWNPFADNPFFSFNMNDPFFESDFFTGINFRDIPLQLSSTPVDIRVKPLPGQPPATFTGGVGIFTISDELAEQDFTTDDVITYKIKISGKGNTKLIGVPEIRWDERLGATEPYSTDSILSRNPDIEGRKTITYYFNPSEAGTYKLPGVVLSYFNPATQQYETIQTTERTITITQGNKAAGAGTGSPADDPTGFSYWYLVVPAVIAAAILAVVLTRSKHPGIPRTADPGPQLPALAIASRRLRSAQERIGESNKEFYEELNKALWLYISQKYDMNLGALVKTDAIQQLSSRGVAQNIIADIQYLTQKCELALYTPINDIEERESLLARTQAVIVALEKSV